MRIYSFLSLFIVSNVLFAQTTVSVSSKIKSAVVYPRGAQVEHEASKFLTAGRQLITFTGLASELDPSSISVSTSGDVRVLSVSSQVNHLKESAKPKRVVMLEDSIETFEFDLKFNQNMLGVFGEERKMIIANQKVGWEKTAFAIEDLEDLSDFYRDRLADIMLKEMELQSKEQKLKDRLARMKAQLSEYNSKLGRSTGEILVEVQVPSNGNIDFVFKYMVRNAGWVPSYNVNVAEVDQPLQVSYNAKVFQNTGLDWDGVQLTLTNANPNLNGTKPEIHPWRLYFIETPQLYGETRGYMSNKMLEMAAPQSAMAMDDEMEDAMIGAEVNYPANEAVTQFKIKTKHNIPSNGKPQAISIDVFTVPAKYEYYTAPKFDPTAFLIAKVSGFETYDLLPGEANLFLSNTYVGQAFINPKITSDTLELSLGRDQSIVVKREKIKDFSSSKKIGNSTKESLGIELSIRNTKGTKIQLVIEDQIPISTDNDIEVSLQNGGGAKVNSNIGKLTWTKVILGNSTESVTFKYDVKYPAERKINL